MTHYIVDFDTVRRAYQKWTLTFPTITPYYAVKCNPDPLLIRTLSNLGAGFDCASPSEIDLALRCSDRIIYANPCKRPGDIKYASSRGITKTTFDSMCEIDKMGEYASTMELVLRIRADDPNALCTLGNKYGAGETDWDDLISHAKNKGCSIVGVSFHVGSGARSARAYSDALYTTSRAIEVLQSYGYKPYLIDIGGGFSSSMNLDEVAEYVHEALRETGLDTYTVIAEPGRYFAQDIATLYTEVIGIKPGAITIDESLYGAFNCILMDHAEPEPELEKNQKMEYVTLFGSTCDGADIIIKDIQLPVTLRVGDMLTWKSMGAYTMAATTNFNGIPFSKRKIYYLNI